MRAWYSVALLPASGLHENDPDETTLMKRFWPLAALGIAAYVLFALFTLPASILVSRLARLGIVAAGVDGTVWNGRAQVLQAGNTLLGSVTWDLHALPLFLARLQADVKLTRIDGFAQATIALMPSGRLDVSRLTASLPLSALPPAAIPGGWAGLINLKLATLTVEKGWPTRVEGTIEAMGLTGPARKPANMGSYKVTFPAAPTGNELAGSLTDLGGPLEIAGSVRLKPDRSYLIEGVVAMRPDAPKAISDTLQFLGTPDAQGRRPFSIAGTT